MSEAPRYSAYAEELGREIGLDAVEYYRSGAFKETYRATDRSTGEVVALKLLPHTSEGHMRLSRELDLMRKCSSPLFPKLIYADYRSAEDGRRLAVVVEEFLDGGSLADRLGSGPMSASECVSMARTLLMAIEFLRNERCVHRDIKPENIMFRSSPEAPVLVDFGLVRDLAQPSATLSWLPHGPGTPFYAAPEQLNNDKDLIDWRTDQFALGVVMSIAVTGLHPYQKEGESAYEVVGRVAARAQPPESTKRLIASRGLGAVLRMTKPWPVHRFPSVPLLRNAIG